MDINVSDQGLYVFCGDTGLVYSVLESSYLWISSIEGIDYSVSRDNKDAVITVDNIEHRAEENTINICVYDNLLQRIVGNYKF